MVVLVMVPGLLLFSDLAGPIQHFKADFCGREVFRCGPLLDVQGSLQLL